MNPQEITLSTQILEIVAAHKTTEPVFRKYDQLAGECVLCNALFETLETMAARYGLDVDDVLQQVRQAASHPAQSEHPEQRS
ncbi:hypothetical protein [Desulfoplanes sp.]